MSNKAAFWQTKKLGEMTRDEWEKLCDGCGKCCLHKLEDEDTGEVYYSEVACRFMNHKTCRCSKYTERRRYVPHCVVISPDNVGMIDWMPSSCAYRRLAEGRGLANWHPLVSGKAETVIKAGISVSGRVVGEKDAGDLEDHLVDWPNFEGP